MKQQVISRTDYDTTGLVTNKVYADGKGPRYDYTPDGKLATRTWARGIITTYTYDNSGALTNTVYSDGTPTISLAYNRAGRQIQAIDAAGVTTFLYDDFGNCISSLGLGTNRTYTANNLNQYTSVSNSAASALSAREFIPQYDDDGNQTLIQTATGIWSVTYNGENRSILWTLVLSSAPNSSTHLDVLRPLGMGPAYIGALIFSEIYGEKFGIIPIQQSISL